jgi:hypothetical protein
MAGHSLVNKKIEALRFLQIIHYSSYITKITVLTSSTVTVQITCDNYKNNYTHENTIIYQHQVEVVLKILSYRFFLRDVFYILASAVLSGVPHSAAVVTIRVQERTGKENG